ncbi:MAG: hypothetical protein VKL60_14915 [Sphaerospermopsis sp.]|nr:hypothetical protein [Sphaerospermopsis sp.]
MNTTIYNKGRSYCYKLNRTLYRDILHDSWLHWYEKTSRDLFDEPMSRVIRVIKLTWWGYYINPRKVQNRKVFVEYEDNNLNEVTPEDILIAKEIDEAVIANSPKLQIEIYMLAIQGFKPYEICEILDMSKSHVSYYFNKIKSYLAHFN